MLIIFDDLNGLEVLIVGLRFFGTAGNTADGAGFTGGIERNELCEDFVLNVLSKT